MIHPTRVLGRREQGLLQVRNYIKRFAVYVLGLFILSIGVNVSKLAGLGISPVSSVPYSLELITGISMGTASLIVYSFFILLQIILLRRNYQPIQLLQIITTFFFSYFVNFTDHNNLLSFVPLPGHYIVQLIYVFIGILITGLGVFLYLLPNLLAMPPEGLVAALVKVTHDRFTFSRMKVIFDEVCGLTGLLAALIFLGNLGPVREGTILSALLIGKVVGLFNKLYLEHVTTLPLPTQKPAAPSD